MITKLLSWMLRLSLVLLVGCLCGCGAAMQPSRNPIAPLSSAVEAPELTGTWVTASAEEQTDSCKKAQPGSDRLHFYPLKNANVKTFGIDARFSIDAKELASAKELIDASELRFSAVGYVTPLKNGRFINIRITDMVPPLNQPEYKRYFDLLTHNYTFVVYSIDRPASVPLMKIALLPDPSDEMAEAPPLKFNRHPLARSGGALVDSSANIAKYVSSLDVAALFHDVCLLRKAD